MRFYEPTISADEISNTYRLNCDNSHHFSHVLRGKVGDGIVLFNGVSGEYSAVVCSMKKDHVSCIVNDYKQINRSREAQVDLVFSLAANTKLSLILQKCTELGVSHLYPVQADRSQSRLDKYTAHHHSRNQKIIIAAMMQCGLNIRPKLHQPTILSNLPWPDWEESAKLICHPGQRREKTLPSQKRTIWFVGPEGGWTDGEVAYFGTKGCQMSTLAPTILRMETACIVAMSQGIESI
ncbi:MAG: hypothetical protein CMF52_08360 [Legionellales bacterium]|nr:hypothetical protein [Legionellales bacterium]